MRILAVHAYYAQPGGEDRSFDVETRLLEEAGYEVLRSTVQNSDWAAARSGPNKTAGAAWNRQAATQLGSLGRVADLALVYNTFPSLSLSVVRALLTSGVPVALFFRNYRISCVSGNHFRDGKPCFSCRGRTLPLEGVLRGCYRDSRLASAAVAGHVAPARLGSILHHKDLVSVFLSEAQANILSTPGLFGRTYVKPNYVPAPTTTTGNGTQHEYLYAGRLSVDKGVDRLLDAWSFSEAREQGARLHIMGDGPLQELVRTACDRDRTISYAQHGSSEAVLRAMSDSQAIVVPSQWAEPFGRVAIESMSVGTHALVSAVGGLPEIVTKTGAGLVVAGNAVGDWAGALTVHNLTPPGQREAVRAAAEAHYGRRAQLDHWAALIGMLV